MRKLLFFFSFFPFLSNAQNKAKLEEDKFVSSIGYKVAETLKVKIGIGSMPDRDKYVSSASTSLLQFCRIEYQGLYRPNALMRTQSSLEYKISKMRAELRGMRMCVIQPSAME